MWATSAIEIYDPHPQLGGRSEIVGLTSYAEAWRKLNEELTLCAEVGFIGVQARIKCSDGEVFPYFTAAELESVEHEHSTNS